MVKIAEKKSKTMNLIIVESPTKAKTISHMLGKNFKIESSFGHIRDLPKSKIGIDIENNFEPQYIIPVKSKKIVSNLKKLAEKSEKIILATDQDREGEAIAWHLIKALGLDSKKNSSHIIERIVFHEITKKAIEDALSHPRELDLNLVDAQQARRVLDRLVGYNLSPFLWKKIMSKLSAGRVQSVALRLVVDREREIEAFKPQAYFGIEALIKKIESKETFISYLKEINKKPIEKPGILDKQEAEKIFSNLEDANWKIDSIEAKDKKRRPGPPFTTSTLQQAAWNAYKFSAKRTMISAQQLYEGIDLKSQGRVGLITYMRTDSFNLSEESLVLAREFLSENFGKNYALNEPRRFKTKSKSAQEAHEAIRPTHVSLVPEKIKENLTPEQFKVYKLVWQRFLATQMPEAVFEETAVNILANPKESRENYLFESKGLVLKFDGFLKIYPLKLEGAETILPALLEKDKIEAEEINIKNHETKPPARFNEASLIKALEKYGIGRPSTYAPTLATIQERGYVEKGENKNLIPTEIGIRVTDLLKEHFSNIVDINFTAKMEEDLDEIADGKIKWQPIIKDFYGPFSENLEKKYIEVREEKFEEKTDEICENCGKPMVIKMGRFGKFIACSGFPECKTTKKIEKPLGLKCPKCKEGDVVQRKAKKSRRVFYGCSKYPDCDFSSWEKPKEIKN